MVKEAIEMTEDAMRGVLVDKDKHRPQNSRLLVRKRSDTICSTTTATHKRTSLRNTMAQTSSTTSKRETSTIRGAEAQIAILPIVTVLTAMASALEIAMAVVQIDMDHLIAMEIDLADLAVVEAIDMEDKIDMDKNVLHKAFPPTEEETPTDMEDHRIDMALLIVM